ncbi:MAG: DnaJ domain-containing protein [Halochromatium sp.]
MSDPFLVLGVDPAADDAAVEAAYRSAIKRYPPDRAPAAFQAVREAYERVRTQRDRVAYRLFETEPPRPVDILRRAEAKRRAAASMAEPDAEPGAESGAEPGAGAAVDRAGRANAGESGGRPDAELIKALLRGER